MSQRHHVHRTQIFAAQFGSVAEARRLVLILSKGICYLCKQRLAPDFTLDHVVPISKGGKTELTNLRAVHPKCNETKDNQLLDQFLPRRKASEKDKAS